jgi:hypothetical protein
MRLLAARVCNGKCGEFAVGQRSGYFEQQEEEKERDPED